MKRINPSATRYVSDTSRWTGGLNIGVHMGKRDLKLNSLSRYSKESPQFVLEEHGHCEVPAGCGGVVLRWTNPHRAIPVELWLVTSGKASLYLDGTAPASGRPVLEYGEHVLALRISDPDPVGGVLMFAGVYDEEKQTHTHLSRKTGRKVYILSTADESWKYTNKEPDDNSWMMLKFDDSSWQTMKHCDFPEPGEQDENRFRARKLREFGAPGLTISEAVDHVWIRKVFSLSRA
jgi:hypothetical protein